MSASKSGTFWSHFFEIYEAIRRQGPGDRMSTERALRLLPPLTRGQRILDIGCGAGAQTIDLARATEAQIVAVDLHEPFVSRLTTQAAELGLADRITPTVSDMNDLRFPDGSFDVLWCEGAIVIIIGSFAKGLSAWRRLLVPGGHMVVSDLLAPRRRSNRAESVLQRRRRSPQRHGRQARGHRRERVSARW